MTTAMTPAYGRAPRGERVEASAPASWESMTVVAAVGLDGVRAPLAFPGAINAPTFQSYVEQVLVPALRRGDVVVFDNLKSHLGRGCSRRSSGPVRRAPAAAVQPGLQPDRGDVLEIQGIPAPVGARAKERLYEAIGEGLREITRRDILGWFRHAGQCVMQA